MGLTIRTEAGKGSFRRLVSTSINTHRSIPSMAAIFSPFRNTYKYLVSTAGEEGNRETSRAMPGDCRSARFATKEQRRVLLFGTVGA